MVKPVSQRLRKRVIAELMTEANDRHADLLRQLLDAHPRSVAMEGVKMELNGLSYTSAWLRAAAMEPEERGAWLA